MLKLNLKLNYTIGTIGTCWTTFPPFIVNNTLSAFSELPGTFYDPF